MVASSPKRRVLNALLGGRPDRTPVTSIIGCGGAVNVEMQETTGIYWPDAHRDPEKMPGLAIAGYELAGIECVKILGSVRSKRTLISGSLEPVKAEVKKAIGDGADLIEPSCGIPAETSTANIKVMVEAVKEFGGRN